MFLYQAGFLYYENVLKRTRKEEHQRNSTNMMEKTVSVEIAGDMNACVMTELLICDDDNDDDDDDDNDGDDARSLTLMSSVLLACVTFNNFSSNLFSSGNLDKSVDG